MDRLQEELIAYIEGELPPDARARVERSVAESPEMQAELDWLRSAYADIESTEQGAQPAAPEIDIVDAVMRAVTKAGAPGDVISLDAARASRRRWWPVIAAAAAVAVIAGYLVVHDSGSGVPPNVAVGPGTQIKPNTPGTSKGPIEPTKLAKSIEALDKKRGEIGAVGEKTLTITPAPILHLPNGLPEVVEARRDAATKGASIDKLLEWARMNRQTALKVADAPDAAPEAMVGAAESLSGEDQRRILLTAIGRMENDPNSRMQLAKNLEETAPASDPAVEAQSQTQALAQLSDIKAIDPSNALPYYFEAKIQLDQGDTQGALDALKQAANLSTASAYSLESALAEAKALEASGMETDAARMVAALTAGVDENNFLCQLADDLLKYAQDFMSAKDPATAQAIYDGVEQMGRQVVTGANLSQEQLAGLDIQRYALEGLGQLYATVESADGVASVTEAMNALTAQVEDLAGLFNALDEMFLKPMTTDFWNMVSGLILGTGDITLVQNPQVTSAAPAPTAP